MIVKSIRSREVILRYSDGTQIESVKMIKYLSIIIDEAAI